VVSGTRMLTYWPARKPKPVGASMATVIAVFDSRVTDLSAAWKLCGFVLQAAEEAVTAIAMSLSGTIWQASARPCVASSSDSASSM